MGGELEGGGEVVVLLHISHTCSHLVTLFHAEVCPGCGTGVVHARGHHCHHISPGTGCLTCGTHFCYQCGIAHLPGASHNSCPTPGCKLWCDATCSCPDCTDCRPGQPCEECQGECWTCRPELRKPLQLTAAALAATQKAQACWGEGGRAEALAAAQAATQAAAAVKAQAEAAAAAAGREWACPACTLVNAAEVAACGACGGAQPARAAAGGSSSSSSSSSTAPLTGLFRAFTVGDVVTLTATGAALHTVTAIHENTRATYFKVTLDVQCQSTQQKRLQVDYASVCRPGAGVEDLGGRGVQVAELAGAPALLQVGDTVAAPWMSGLYAADVVAVNRAAQPVALVTVNYKDRISGTPVFPVNKVYLWPTAAVSSAEAHAPHHAGSCIHLRAFAVGDTVTLEGGSSTPFKVTSITFTNRQDYFRATLDLVCTASGVARSSVPYMRVTCAALPGSAGVALAEGAGGLSIGAHVLAAWGEGGNAYGAAVTAMGSSTVTVHYLDDISGEATFSYSKVALCPRQLV